MAYQWSVLDRYGALSYPAGTQGTVANAKDDTLYYAVTPNFATDLSQYADNQVAGASWTYEASPATRFNVLTSWTLEFDCDTDNNDTGSLFNYSSGASALALSLNGAGSVLAQIGGVTLATLALPGIGAGAEQLVIAWASEPNLLTTGAGDALRSELRAFNVTDGSYSQIVFTHAARASLTGDLVLWARTTGGSSPFSGTRRRVRISTGRFRTSDETREDFISQTAAPTITGATRIEFPIVEPACGLEAAGEMAGPVLAMGASSVWSMGLRLLSPIVNENFLEREGYAGLTFINLPTHWARAAPAATYTLFGCYLFYRPVPTFVNRLKVRVHVQQWRTAGATNDRVHLRAYSLNRPPNPTSDVVDADAAIAVRSCSASISTSHGSGAAAGEWLDLGLCDVVRNSDGCTWLVLAARLEDLSGAPANNRFRIGAITIEPVVLE